MNTFGEKFAFTSFGESHGRAIGGVLDGVPAGLHIDLEMIKQELDRRAGRAARCLEAKGERLKAKGDEVKGERRKARGEGREAGVSPRALREADEVEWLSGVMDGVTLGTPIAFIIRNSDARPEDYEWLRHTYRIGHADRVYQEKYGIRDHRGGGRASARETASRVVAGSIAKQLLHEKGIHIEAKLVQVGEKTNPADFEEYINQIRQEGDSIGGIVECRITGITIGVGEPIFDKLQSHLAFAMMSINACKGFEYGSGFSGVSLKGSEMYLTGDSQLISGGMAGGISDGTPIVFRCVFKPTASSRKTLETIEHPKTPRAFSGTPLRREAKGEEQEARGRHDACVAVRAVPVVEAMAAIVIADWHDF
ncbi:MAG: chorismate synthase [Paludibacteraceae bacterium]|nr:chorismate synthase [Paludibacteraceae bacterium]